MANIIYRNYHIHAFRVVLVTYEQYKACIWGSFPRINDKCIIACLQYIALHVVPTFNVQSYIVRIICVQSTYNMRSICVQYVFTVHSICFSLWDIWDSILHVNNVLPFVWTVESVIRIVTAENKLDGFLTVHGTVKTTVLLIKLEKPIRNRFNTFSNSQVIFSPSYPWAFVLLIESVSRRYYYTVHWYITINNYAIQI